MYDIAIIGGGVTGFGAAMYARRLNLKTVVFSERTGGTIILTDRVENYPGFKLLTGVELAEKLQEHAMEYKPDLIEERAEVITREGKCFRIIVGEKTYEARTVLFATGTKHRELKVPGHDTFMNRGVHYCALCDGAFYRGKVLAVVGGSDSAAKEALVLAQHGSKVYMVYRGEKIRPEPVNYERVLANRKIEIIYHTNVTDILGDKSVSGVRLDRPYKGKDILPLDGVFVAIGLLSLSELAVKLGVKVNPKGEIIINRKSETNIPGVYAAGDVADTEFKQAITGVAEGVTATYHAYKYVSESEVCATGDQTAQ